MDISPENKLDWEIEGDIEELNRWSAFVDADEISVEVEDEIAILSGTVDTWAEYQYAEKNAFKGGAHSVDNDLTVRYGTNVQ